MFPKITFDQLLVLQDVLDQRLIAGQLDFDEYEQEWQSLIEVCGYSTEIYEQLVDDRWDKTLPAYVDRTIN